MQILTNNADLLWVTGMTVLGALSLLFVILVLGAVVMGNRREFMFAETVKENRAIPGHQPSQPMNFVADRSSAPTQIEPSPHAQKPIPAGS